MADNDGAIVQGCPLRSAPEHWIGIELFGEDGRPIAWERYEITLPDGTVRAGFLDQGGKARVDGIADAGDCRISFPDLDAAAWSKQDKVTE